MVEQSTSLTSTEKDALDQTKARFDRHRDYGVLAEGTINQLLTSLLLTLAGLYNNPFFVSTESSLEIELENRDHELPNLLASFWAQQSLAQTGFLYPDVLALPQRIRKTTLTAQSFYQDPDTQTIASECSSAGQA